MSDIVLQGRGICTSFGSKRERRQVLFDVDVDVYEGECLAIIGASGSGKSTLTRVLFGLGSADSGEITYRGQTMGKRGSAVRRMLRGQTGLVFQDPFASLDPRWRVARSVEEPLRLRHKGMGNDEIASQAEHALRVVGLDPAVFAARYPMDLSGGQAQRLALARTLAHPRPVLILDDPFSALDRKTEDTVFANLQEYAKNKTVFLISHRLYHFPQMRQVIFMEDGKTAVGTHAELMASVPVYCQLYESQTGGTEHEDKAE